MFWPFKKVKKISREAVVLFLLLILGLTLRIFRINDNPPSLNWDEVSHGFNAYSILKTSEDEWGIGLPLIFRCYGDFKLPLYIYLTMIPVAVFGLNPLSVRLISILSGTILILLAYLVSLRVFKNKTVSLLAAFLTAVSPWGLFLSRIAVEANLGAMLFASGAFFFLNWQQKWKIRDLLLSFFFWGLSLYAYNSARILVPLVFVFALINAIKRKKVIKLLVSSFLLIILCLPALFQFLDQSAGARFFWVSPVDQGAVNQIIEKRLGSELPEILTRLLYNRPVYFLTYTFKNYFKHLDPRFLFFKGGSHYQFSLPDFGLLPAITLPFLVIGFIWLLKRRCWFLIFWFLIAFLPSAMTKDAPHVLRTILALPLPLVISSLGLWQTMNWLKKKSKTGGKLLLLVFVIGITVNAIFWWKNYWQIYRPHYAWAWQDGYREAVSFVKENYSKYDKIVFTKKYGEPHEFILFWWPWEPSYYQDDPKKVWDYHANWYWVDAFDKFEFWNDWEVKEKIKSRDSQQRVLLITAPENWLEPGKLLKTMNFLNEDKAFEVVEYMP